MLADAEFVAELEASSAPLVEPGRINSLAQTLLKLTAPGVPDIYQGTELWDLCLVDPDNRRPVDYELRRRLLAELADGLEPEEILRRMDDGLPKLWLIRQGLHLRQRRPEAFAGRLRAPRGRKESGPARRGFVRGGEVAVVSPGWSCASAGTGSARRSSCRRAAGATS